MNAHQRSLLSEFDEEMKKYARDSGARSGGQERLCAASQIHDAGQTRATCGSACGFRTHHFDYSRAGFLQKQPEAFGIRIVAQLVQALDEGAAKVRTALQNTSDEAWRENWKLSFQGKPIFEGTRFLAYREMFLNHLVHHRAQLGVYLRLNEKPVPATYGPSADDKMGF